MALRRYTRRDGSRLLAWVLFVMLVAAIGFAFSGLNAAGITHMAFEVPEQGRFGYRYGLNITPEFLALAIGLSIYNATYIAEIVRSGFAAIPAGQSEAAAALGLSGLQTWRLVLLPQAMRIVIPPLTTVYLNLFKSTSLAAAIAYPEVVSVFVGTVNNLVGQPLVIMAMTLLVYASVSLTIALLMNRYHRRIQLTAGHA